MLYKINIADIVERGAIVPKKSGLKQIVNYQ